MDTRREQAVIEAMARLVMAQDALKRASGSPGVLAEILAATSLIAEAQGWLQSARGEHACQHGTICAGERV